MRVSDSMIGELALRGTQNAQRELYEAQRVASSGMRVEKPSDDPVAASLARQTSSRERRADAVAKISDEAVDRLQAVDDTLGSVGDVLSRARELAVIGANDHLSADDRQTLATEVTSLRNQLVNLANTRIDGEYVFAGLAVNTEPFDATGAFSGEVALEEIDVGPGVRLPIQVSGAEIFGVTGGVDPFATLSALEGALNANDGAGVAALLDDLEATVSQVAHGRASAGNAQQALMQARSAAERVRDDAIRRRAELTEADPVVAFTDLVKAESALREAITVASRLPPPSLVEMGG